MNNTMQYTSLLSRTAALFVIGSTLASCASVPADIPLSGPRSIARFDVPTDLNSAGAQAISDTWWTAYGDPGLNALIDKALAGSPDLAIAAARIKAADGQARQAGAATLPSAAIEGSAGGTKQSYNMGFPEQFVPHGVLDRGDLAATLGFNLDLWGRDRAALAAARSEAEAARVDAAQARLMLTSAVALAWGNLAELYAQRDVAVHTALVLSQTEELTAQRQRAGIDGMAELQTARSRHATARQNLAAIDESIALVRNQIAALAGDGPGYGARLPRPAIDFDRASTVPTSLLANLIIRRPDLLSALLRADAAAKRVKVARAGFYPNINLAAVVGLQSLGLGQLFDSGSTYASFGPAISLPIFQGGQLRGRYDVAWAAYDEAVARYEQILVTALHEVADALDSKRALAGRLAAARAADDAASEAARMVQLRYTQGIANQLQLLAAQDAALAAHRSVVELEARGYLLDVMLARALGGGFDPASTAKL